MPRHPKTTEWCTKEAELLRDILNRIEAEELPIATLRNLSWTLKRLADSTPDLIPFKRNATFSRHDPDYIY